MTTHSVWVVITNAMSWGKGETFSRAFVEAMKNTARMTPATQMHIYCIEIPEYDKTEPPLLIKRDEWSAFKSVKVDGMGSVGYPKDATLHKLAHQVISKNLLAAWKTFHETLTFETDTDAFKSSFENCEGLYE